MTDIHWAYRYGEEFCPGQKGGQYLKGDGWESQPAGGYRSPDYPSDGALPG